METKKTSEIPSASSIRPGGGQDRAAFPSGRGQDPRGSTGAFSDSLDPQAVVEATAISTAAMLLCRVLQRPQNTLAADLVARVQVLKGKGSPFADALARAKDEIATEVRSGLR